MYVFPWFVVCNKEDSSTMMFSFWVLEENNNNIWCIMNVWSCEFRHGKTVELGSSWVNRVAGQKRVTGQNGSF